ncbi:oxidoreductase [Streptomyces sp. RG38]|uniref:Oxidoreductase n=2 Tax=Streptomyces tagetis TaxID=2820809 RepID=A0A941B836_9ACTN|nr:PDR/VanB family oxidoreductase [Streptomyces sp. RG38]MBQ0828103.1 oxidoreductase [Streptomyces sp. RG38]
MCLTVTRRAEAADAVLALTLARPDGGPLPSWRPGAHVELLLGDGLVRHYSLCGDTADRSAWRIAVLRAPGSRGGSAYVHDKLHAGVPVRVRGPRENFAFRPAGRCLFVAGGIGITPLLPMVAAAEAAGVRWRLLYGGRSLASMAFLDELAVYGDAVRVVPQDRCGLPDLDGHLGTPEKGTLVYCCGPEAMLTAVEDRCRAWPPGTLRAERFHAAELPSPATESAFDVVLARSDLTLRVPPGRSILEVARAAGAPVLSSCAEGICGTCETGVLEGEPDHRDSVLGPGERESGETLMICVSRARGPRLVLDL